MAGPEEVASFGGVDVRIRVLLLNNRNLDGMEHSVLGETEKRSQDSGLDARKPYGTR